VIGSQAHRVLAFAREWQGKRAIVAVPIRCAGLLENSAAPRIDASLWGDTRIKLPFTTTEENLKGLFTSVAVTKHKELMVGAALGDFPVNLFTQT
jgi:(1->4)-alpha-D-glucan 1-alpha-D-glucosylmutase